MATAQAPVLDMNKLNAFIGQFVTDLGAAVHAGMVVIGEKLGLYKALALGPNDVQPNLPRRPAPMSATCASGWLRRLPAAMSPTMQKPVSSA